MAVEVSSDLDDPRRNRADLSLYVVSGFWSDSCHMSYALCEDHRKMEQF